MAVLYAGRNEVSKALQLITCSQHNNVASSFFYTLLLFKNGSTEYQTTCQCLKRMFENDNYHCIHMRNVLIQTQKLLSLVYL